MGTLAVTRLAYCTTVVLIILQGLLATEGGPIAIARIQSRQKRGNLYNFRLEKDPKFAKFTASTPEGAMKLNENQEDWPGDEENDAAWVGDDKPGAGGGGGGGGRDDPEEDWPNEGGFGRGGANDPWPNDEPGGAGTGRDEEEDWPNDAEENRPVAGKGKGGKGVGKGKGAKGAKGGKMCDAGGGGKGMKGKDKKGAKGKGGKGAKGKDKKGGKGAKGKDKKGAKGKGAKGKGGKGKGKGKGACAGGAGGKGKGDEEEEDWPEDRRRRRRDLGSLELKKIPVNERQLQAIGSGPPPPGIKVNRRTRRGPKLAKVKDGEGGGDNCADASYMYSVDTDEIWQEAKSDAEGFVKGQYSFVDPDGKKHGIEYEAGPNIGFKVIKVIKDSDEDGDGGGSDDEDW